MGIKGELVLVERAVRNRWITEDLKPKVVDAVKRGLSSGDSRAELRAAQIVLMMERQNQLDEQSESAQLLKLVLEQLAELGVDVASLGISEATTSAAIEGSFENTESENVTR